MYMYIIGFESHPRQLIFLRKSDCLGCAVLLCLVCLTLLASFFLPAHLSLKHVHVHVHVHDGEMKKEGRKKQARSNKQQHVYTYTLCMTGEAGCVHRSLGDYPADISGSHPPLHGLSPAHHPQLSL